jgi:hypothetical protein
MSPSRYVTISHNIAGVTKQKCVMVVQLLMNWHVFVVFWYHQQPDIPYPESNSPELNAGSAP